MKIKDKKFWLYVLSCIGLIVILCLIDTTLSNGTEIETEQISTSTDAKVTIIHKAENKNKVTTTKTTTSTAARTTTVTTTSTVAKTTIVTTTTAATTQETYYVYKESTHYIHLNTCHWANSGDVVRIDNTKGIEAIVCDECNPQIEIENEYVEPTTEASSNGLTFVKTFSRGTYFSYGYSCTGGSGRSLIDCSYGNGIVKGSIASSYLYYLYGYNYNGSRTMVYLEISGYPSMNGYYYLDDCDAGNSNVIDFFYIYGSNCAFRNQGVVSVDCYIVN